MQPIRMRASLPSQQRLLLRFLLTQYHYLDESGDPGLGGDKTSSTHFALAMVQLAEQARLPALMQVRDELHLAPSFEFKFYKMKARQKNLFFQALQSVEFRVRVLIVDKSRLERQLIELSGQDFTIELITRLVLRTSPLDIANDVLIIDGATPSMLRTFRIRLSAECRKNGRVRPFSKIVHGESSREDGLQIADMIAGAVRYYKTENEPECYRMCRSKIVDLWE